MCPHLPAPTGLTSNLTALFQSSKYGSINPRDMLAVYKNSTWLSLSYTLPTVGFDTLSAYNTSAGITVPSY